LDGGSLEKSVVDLIVTGTRFASKLLRPLIIYSSIVGSLFGIPTIHLRQWTGLSIFAWWKMMAGGTSPDRKAISSLTLLVTWEIWNERNARVFRNKQAPLHVVLDRVKSEARLWVTVGARHLGNIMSEE
jgi:hypothetical protein